MYLEISERRSGKTTRLIAAVEAALETREVDCAVVVVSSNMALNNIKQMMGPDIIRQVVFTSGMYSGWYPEDMGDPGLKHLRFFVDEFDHFDPSVLFIDPEAYYTGTLRTNRLTSQRNRDHFLLELLTASRYNYQHFKTLPEART